MFYQSFRQFFRTFEGRALIILFSPFLAVVSVVSYVFWTRHETHVMRTLCESVAREIVLLQETTPQAQQIAIAHALGFRVEHRKLGARPIDHTTKKDAAGVYGDWRAQEAKNYLLNHAVVKLHEVTIRDEEMALVLKNNHCLTFLLSTKRFFPQTVHILFAWFCGVSVIFFVAAMLFMRGQVRSLKRLMQLSADIGQRKIHIDRLEGACEIRHIFRALCDINNKFVQTMEDKQFMLMALSHDLRSPCEHLRQRIATLSLSSIDIMPLTQEVEHIQRMVESCVNFLSTDKGDQSYCAVEDIVHDVSLRLQPNGIEWQYDMQGCWFNGPRTLFDRCIYSVLENALQHAKEKIFIQAYAHGRDLIVWIHDDGGHIDPHRFSYVSRKESDHQQHHVQNAPSTKDLEHTTPLRPPSSSPIHEESVQAHALALAFVQNILARHKGSLTFRPSFLGGMAICMTWPQE